MTILSSHSYMSAGGQRELLV